jgi:hypothetical protein
MLRTLSLSVLLVARAAGAQAPKPQAPKPQPPLAAFVAERIIVLPVQLLRADSAGWLDTARWDAFRK